MSHLDLANEPFQLIIGSGQPFHIVASEQSPPKAVKALVDVVGNTLVFGIVCAASGQVNQVMLHGLPNAGAAFGWIALRIE